ncbi:hypothetical protein SAMN05216302_105317 [Nitrosomonas aestuarii]|uniref:Uncharacterized protein n=1 Tax=Nitrosomonas aestuarii TaxID=52441 RepID=A0A1I4GH35_9PROT|nr:hypothetical protein [Nitrosomonas aestuarii]SFL28501.1 hypothetical protein SAMN05216302_105317 [Nitrosomonas aestuarii]
MTSLINGDTYRIENGFNDWKGGNLDACGRAACCRKNLYDVNTSAFFSTEKLSSIWKIESANGKAAGTPVVTNDAVYLINQHEIRSYLDVCGGGIHIQDASTKPKKNQDTTVWIILAHSGGEIHEGDTVSLLNESSELKDEGYLHTDKYPPICDENLFNVSVGYYSPDFTNERLQWRFIEIPD